MLCAALAAGLLAYTFDVTLDELTWASLDISPDGKTIVFDLLGDLYTLPIDGGQAKRITSGSAHDAQPRFSPDGARIVFVSDRSGRSGLWLVDVNGTSATALTPDANATFSSPAWMPDGQHVVVSRRDESSAGTAHELWEYPVTGSRGHKLIGHEQGPLGAAPSREGRWIYFTRSEGNLPARIERFDRRTGRIDLFADGYGGAVRPAVSPDGRWLAFGRRVGTGERLVLRNLMTGAERLSGVELDRDQQGNGARDADFLPGYAFTPDSSSIVYAARGKIRRHDLAGEVARVIPFQARFQQEMRKPLTVRSRVEDGPVYPRLLRWTHESPDRKTLYFSAAGKNYRYDRTRKRVTPVGDGPGLEYSPAVSPDGRWLAYVTWSDKEAGHIYQTSTARDVPVRLTEQAGHYEHLAWSPDGTKLVFLQSSGGELRGEGNLEENIGKTVRWIATDGKGPTHIVTTVKSRGDRRQEMRPTFNRTGTRIYFAETPVRRKATWLSSIQLDGCDARRHLELRFADDIMVSPDERWVAFTEQHEVYLAPLDMSQHVPTRLSVEGGYFVNWTHDGEAVTWSWGRDYFRMPLRDAVRPASRAKPSREEIRFSEPRALGIGQVLLQGARIVSMGGPGVIERGDILIDGHRIRAVGTTGQLGRFPRAKVIDVAGKTIIPGLIDTHAHYRENRNAELYPQADWGYVVQLAYGVTTIRDPSARSQSIFTQAEMIEMGRTLGPRVYSTGEPIYFAETAFARPVRDLDDARLQVRRLKKLGATAIKEYILPHREQRQWLLQAIREEGLLAIPEGAAKIHHDITLIADGYSTLEHAIKAGPLYRDVRSLLVSSGIYYVPTLINGIDGSAEDYFYQESDVFRDEKLLRFTPYAEVAARARQRTLRPEEDFAFKPLGESAAQVLHEGGRVVLGAHGNRPGIGAHWELWAMAMGGLTPLEALRTATLDAAGALGLDEDLGSIEPGKIADLVVLDANPLQNVRNTSTIRYVMKNGVLWAGATMNEVWPQEQPFAGFYWQIL
jgi:imidazolonepropionase-like amidohydrolase/Tol biopolymer transport system component